MNPFSLPTKTNTLDAFFKQLKTVGRLANLAKDVPVGNSSTELKKRFFVYFGGMDIGVAERGVIEDGLMAFRCTCVDRNTKYVDLVHARDMAEKVNLIKEHPLIVEVMYRQLFHEFSMNDIRVSFEDFGIGVNEEFRFDLFYREDHGNILI